MSTWSPESSVVTNLGASLLASARIGLGTIKITRIVARENFESSMSAARSYTLADITDASVKQEGYILSMQKATYPDPEEEIETSLVSVRFSNDDLEDETETYNLRQIVVLATLVDATTHEEGEEVPYMVSQCDDSSDCDVMPAHNSNPTSFDYDLYVIHSGVEDITIELRTSGYVFDSEFEEFQEDVAQDFIDLEEKFDNESAGTNTEGSTVTAWTPSWSDDDHSTWSAEDASSTVTCQDGAERFNTHAEKVYNRDNIAYGKRSAAFGGMSEALGDDSFAAGLCNYASGPNSAVFGTRNAAKGTSSFVCGSDNETKSGSYASCVFGLSNVAENSYSATFGKNLVNKSSYSLIIGKYNDYSSEAPETYAFVIGDGISGARHNLVTIDWTGEMFLPSIRVGNIKKPNGEPYSFDVNIDYIKGGNGIKSFIANDIDNNSSNGFYSTTFGTGCSANGNSSIAAGMNSTADKMCSFAMGSNSQALGKHSFALGRGSLISSDSEDSFAFYGAVKDNSKNCVAMSGVIENGWYDVVLACDATCIMSDSQRSAMIGCSTSEVNSSQYCFIVGAESSVIESSNSSYIIGSANNTVTNAVNVLVSGNGNEAVNLSSSYLFGNGLKAGSSEVEETSYKFIIGKNNKDTDTQDSSKMFVIGNGASSNNRSNAFEVDQNGNIFCGGSNRSLNAQIDDNTGDITELNGSVSDLSGSATVDRAAITEIVNSGPKNKLSWSAVDKEHNGITFTVNSDGTVTADGTNDGTANSFISIKIMTAAEIGAEAGCILSGTPENDAGAYISLEERGGSYRTYVKDMGTGNTIPAISTEVNVYIVVPKGKTVDNIVFSPMICSKAAWDVSHTYQPYRPSYQELYERIVALEQGVNT